MNYGESDQARARVEFDPAFVGIRALIVRHVGRDGDPSIVRTWPEHQTERLDLGEDPKGEAWLRLSEDEARALYEALASYFGGAGHDTRALRADYDAERKRVDTMIAALIGRAS